MLPLLHDGSAATLPVVWGAGVTGAVVAVTEGIGAQGEGAGCKSVYAAHRSDPAVPLTDREGGRSVSKEKPALPVSRVAFRQHGTRRSQATQASSRCRYATTPQ